MSQEDLGKKLGFESGQYVSNIERGSCPFPGAKIKKLSKISNVEVMEIANHMIEDYRQKLARLWV